MWTTKYAPETSAEVLNAKSATTLLTRWLAAWTTESTPKAAMLHGPCGIGKSTLLQLLAREHGMRVVDVDPAADVKSLHDVFAASDLCGRVLQQSDGTKGCLLVVDDAEGSGSMANVALALPAALHPLLIVSSGTRKRFKESIAVPNFWLQLSIALRD
jgi:hypothetical protein